MTSERWQEVKAVLAAALERTPEERASFLAEACGADGPLRAEVESLIACEDGEGDAFGSQALGLRSVPDALCGSSPAGQLVAGDKADETREQEAGRRIGPYVIVRELARGGMGTVCLAERADSEYRRQVAIKLIRRGMDTDFVLRRFRNERQILAALDHPHIARLLDGGTTEDGLPYLVMEYVEGEPVDLYCDRHALNTEERLRLFRRICSAVSYAHQRLVIHRDLKPSNIIVTPDGTPKLLDFGIAKLLTPELAAQTLDLTSPALRLMTPAYASPEQVRGEPVTTASDVYSLGVLLYELLTGHKPYRVKGRSPHELAQAVLEAEPTRPSTAVGLTVEDARIDDSAGALLTPESVGRSRGESPERLRRRLRGDLDNIVLMALRKDAQRRYASVEQLSEDVRRHLEGRPVLARKDTLRYRATKFARRNKLGVAAALVILFTLVSALVVINQQRARAERRFDEVRRLARAVVFDYHDAIADLPGSTPVRERLVRDALQYLDGLAAEAAGDVTLQRELATAYRKIGDVQGNSHMANLGDTQGALASYRKSLAIRQALALREPENAELRAELAESHERIGDALRTTGDVRAAEESYRLAIAILEEQSAAAPGDRTARRRLADLLYRVGNLKGYPRTSHMGDTSGAIELHRRALSLREALLASDPADANLRLDAVESHRTIANLLAVAAEDAAAAEPHARYALALAHDLAGEDPSNARVRRALLVSQDTLARVLMRKRELDDALAVWRQSLETARMILKGDPANMQARQDMAGAHVLAGNIYLLKGDASAALIHHRQSLSLNEAIASDDPSNEAAARWVAQDHTSVGKAFDLAGNPKEALRSQRRALVIYETLHRKNPGDMQTTQLMARGYRLAGETLDRLGDVAGALESFRKAAELAERELAQDPGNGTMRRMLALTYFSLGELHAGLAARATARTARQAEHWGEARNAYQRSLELMSELRDKGILLKELADKPHQIADKIAACDVELAKLQEN